MGEKKIDRIRALIEKDKKRKSGKPAEKQEITLREYLGLLQENPSIAQSSHSRIYSMIVDEGHEELSLVDQEFFGVEKGFIFFSKYLKGVYSQISEIMEYLKAGSQGLAIGKKILLLFGPPASGKSSFVEVLKCGLESFRKVPIYKIKGCPINEEPLHILPHNMRKDFEDLLGVTIKGDLCLKCRTKLDEYKVRHGEVGYYEIPVELFNISRRRGMGIGRFEPADEKVQDISDITAKENPAVTFNPNRGYDDPDAYTFSGAIPKGNRGLIEAVELVKKGVDAKILWPFINLCEEGVLAVPGSSMAPVDIDSVTIGHCNIIGYKWFANEASHEALHSRIFAIPFGYAIRIKDEVEIYKKLLAQAKNRDADSHIAPGALELVALFSVATRLNPDNDFANVLEKAKFLDGQMLESTSDKNLNIRSVLKKGYSSDDWSKRDGMFGISPRDVMSALSKAIVSEKGCKCLTAKKAMAFLLFNFDNMIGVSPEILKTYKELLANEITAEYKERIIEIINTAFRSTYGSLALQKAKRYLTNIKFHCQKTRKLVEVLGVDEIGEPDYEEMRKVEMYMGFSTAEAANSARGEYYQMYLEYMQGRGSFNLADLPKLEEAVNRVVLDEMQSSMLEMLIMVDDSHTGGNSKQHKKNLIAGLKKLGYCNNCIPEVLEDARKYLKK